MNKEQIQDVKGLIPTLTAYFAELKNLKDSGIDLMKLEAHKTLYSLFLEELFQKFGIENTISIVKYAEKPTCDINFFCTTLIRTIGDVKVESKNPRTEKPEGLSFCTETPSYKSCTNEKISKIKTKDEQLVEEACKKVNEYYLNGKQVSKEVYEKATRVKEEFTDILDELFKEFFK